MRPDAEVSADAIAAADQLADQMLAELAAGSVNPLGPVASRFDTGARRAAVMVGGGVVAMILLFLVMTLVGAFL